MGVKPDANEMGRKAKEVGSWCSVVRRNKLVVGR